LTCERFRESPRFAQVKTKIKVYAVFYRTLLGSAIALAGFNEIQCHIVTV
jgi:hypothetical protein